MKKASYLINICFFILLGYLLWLTINADLEHHFSQQRTQKIKPLILSEHFPPDSIDSSANLTSIFPYDLYLKSQNYKSIHTMKADLAKLDSLFPGSVSKNRQVLSSTLTSELSKVTQNHFTTYQPDSLLNILKWAESFLFYSEIDPTNYILYQSIYQYWFDTIANSLHKFSYKNPSLKYDFKFEYIQARLMERGAVPDIKKTSFEKVIDNFIHNKWSHLLNASWSQSSGFQKLICLLIFLITIYGYICIIKMHWTKRLKV
jgi:hypothetical protein